LALTEVDLGWKRVVVGKMVPLLSAGTGSANGWMRRMGKVSGPKRCLSRCYTVGLTWCMHAPLEQSSMPCVGDNPSTRAVEEERRLIGGPSLGALATWQ
jgi:hypothetical protein